MIKSIFVVLPEDLHWRIKQKCRYYNLPMQTVIVSLLERFDAGEFDKDFNLPERSEKISFKN